MNETEKYLAVKKQWREAYGEANRSQAQNRLSADSVQIGGTHYRDMPIQPWELMEAVLTKEEFIGFLRGNAIKYSLRAGRKAGSEDDAAKAKHYMEKLREVQSK
jgi:hypothetical protein